jgi:hypothetical protein
MLPDRFDTFRHPAPNEINAVRNEIALDSPTDSTLFDIPALAEIDALRNEIASRPNPLKNRCKTSNVNQINRVRNEIQPTTPRSAAIPPAPAAPPRSTSAAPSNPDGTPNPVPSIGQFETRLPESPEIYTQRMDIGCGHGAPGETGCPAWPPRLDWAPPATIAW